MRWTIILAVLMAAQPAAWAQPADCLTAPSEEATLQLSLDLASRPGMPPGVGGEAYVAVPMQTPGIACAIPPLPSDVLRGERGNLLNPATE
jgi:hypothetical protein